MKKWWQVEIHPKVFGFSSVNGVIKDHPNWDWVGKKLEQYKPFLLGNNAKVYFIAEHPILT